MFRSFEFSVIDGAQKRVYFCQRCLNHGRAELRRNHKSNCPYAHCRCAECFLVERRRELNTRLNSLETRNSLKEHPGRCVVDEKSSSSSQLLGHQRLKGGK
ncbi:DM DNA-binding domain-containing protein [Aphelenchoides besseyi]|nr:DM DNA-binding domain-containing protein [Aphelenchoides besseyi]